MFQVNRQPYSHRGKRGAITMELVSVLAWLTLAGIIGLDLGFCLWGAWINDAACREAVRAAATQATKDDAIDAAKTAIKSVISESKFVGATTGLFDSAHFKYETFEDSSGNPDISKAPFVTVSTTTAVRLPIPLRVKEFGADIINYQQSYSYPILTIKKPGP